MRQKSYQDIRALVLARIHAQIWPPGARIPGEADLAAEFGCARATVNRALRELAEAGLIERRRKAGTRVAVNPVRKATLELPVVRLEVEGRGETYDHKLLLRETETPPDHVRARMNLPAGVRLLHLKTLHMADACPYMFEDRWLNRRTATGIDAADLNRISANEWLVQNVPFSGGDIAFFAAAASGDEAGALNIAPETAIFVVERTTWRGLDPVTATRLAYAPGYRMTTRI